jgi:hypothetical protein
MTTRFLRMLLITAFAFLMTTATLRAQDGPASDPAQSPDATASDRDAPSQPTSDEAPESAPASRPPSDLDDDLLAGVAGMVEVSTSFGRLRQGISPGYGYMAIVIAAAII